MDISTDDETVDWPIISRKVWCVVTCL